jgi:hypothetical protein
MAAVSEELSAERIGKGLVPRDSTPEKLWGELGPVLEPCWKKRITSESKSFKRSHLLFTFLYNEIPSVIS